eukprot:TRINITY_DN33615_c0_g1_i1.p1 TRINITY_DN33615_c0_g1~~TRINITY_DN33615_c0_g1_i1.p1  ORF type:complete len:384 (+),score=76.11 TRINITY_DN33615_c0_g1_i1:88-1239(+)
MSNVSTDYKSDYGESEESEEEEEEEDVSLSPSASEGPPPVPDVVGGRYRVQRQIGSGSYSEVYLGRDEETGVDVAVKAEWTKAEKGDKLLGEARLYEDLGKSDDAPHILWSGTEGEYNVMVMELLGPCLDSIFKKRQKFSLKTTLMLAEQFIDRLQFVHERGILYRDIKPHNFLMGIGANSRRVYIVDFGLAKKYLDPKTGDHIKGSRKKKRGVTGTVRYSSLNVHAGYDAGRRDDLEATGYMLIHFLRGDLPWLGLKATSKMTKHEMIGQKKSETPDEELCRGHPDEFVEYFRYCRSLQFADRPDYDHLRRLFRDLFERRGFERDWLYDWLEEASSQDGEGCSRSAKRRRSGHCEKNGATSQPARSRSRSRSRSRRSRKARA